MSVDLSRDGKVSTAQKLYEALAAGDRDKLGQLLHPEFIGRAAQGLPLNMGGTHVGPDAMREKLWWRIGKHFTARAEPEDFQVVEDGRLMVVGTYRGSARRTGNPLEAVFIHVLSFAEDGRIAALHQLTDTAAWRAALDGTGALQTIEYDVRDGVATICLNRPEVRNAIDLQMGRDTLEVARRVAAERTVRAVLICGNGSALTVGGDIAYFIGSAEGAFGDLFVKMTTPFHQAFEIFSRIDAPIVTAAHGAVAGGGLGFVYTADVVVAAETARFVTAFAGIGLSGDGGGTWHLPRLIGPRRASAAYLRNTPITALEALEWGLVNEVVPDTELRARAKAVATEWANGPTVAYSAMRALLRDSWRNDLAAQLAAESRSIKRTGDSADAAEAIAAFVGKRRPSFTGR
jgi:2-(1,2-epoxy-1,2-dihydrophenyl)acetyl-CoA isomerase